MDDANAGSLQPPPPPPPLGSPSWLRFISRRCAFASARRRIRSGRLARRSANRPLTVRTRSLMELIAAPWIACRRAYPGLPTRVNGEIASELFLSRKTVETHIRIMFRKLGASSRVEIARAVEKADKVLARDERS